MQTDPTKKNKKSTQLIYLHKQIDALTNIH